MQRHCGSHTLSGTKKALVSAAGPNMQEILACSEPTFEQFADIHGYDLVIDRQLRDHSRHQHPRSREGRWGKIALLEATIQSHDFVVWMDADVMVHKFDRDIAEDVPTNCFQAFVLELFPHRFNPNSGVWALRQDEESIRFLEAVRGIGQLDHTWADQDAICTALGWDIGGKKGGGAKPVHYSPYLARTGWLPPEWNPLGLASRWPSRTEHFAGMPNEERLPLMQNKLQRLRNSGILRTIIDR